MRYKICLALLLLFSFNVDSVTTYAGEGTYYEIERCSESLSEFKENGVKSKYIVDKNLNEVINELKNNISNLYLYKAECINNNELILKSSQETVHMLIYAKKNFVSVEIEIVNKDRNHKLNDLMKELTQLQNKKAKSIRYFQYVKGKVNNEEAIKLKLKDTLNIRNIDTLNIHNGYVGKGNLYNGDRVNFAVSTYDTGAYLIIGTPIIFATY